ncbi:MULTISPECIES: hypothetical protein [Staphylococcus cohnii species complex]|uniref:Uncharacterized protein n=1 Tax=Staphylococcus ureilyticus TaxID=94138 RepID=A0AB34AJN2_STAUR|nr:MULTISPECIES: hypothetical protein [Staphylococcus]PNZ47939.1 hypothetical protein CD150_01065 [Staphylococcus ureilyticus]QKU19115.1 hypothetical protein FOC52_10080 [Staphylococcus cohnii]GEQ03468.1 hypothetical protein SCO02_19090 [Staphylococcus ureilyticus]
MSEVKMITYEPIIFKKRKGNKIINENVDIPPFLDASFRTEPSLNRDYPGITSLCRKSKLAPHLKVGDKVVYITKKGEYTLKFRHWRLVAILEVIETFESHYDAAKWYRENNYELPKNCIVDDNPPLSLNKTTINSQREIDKIEKWYNERAKEYPQFNICKKEYVELENPPIIDESKMRMIFNNTIPGTQNPKRLSGDQYKELIKLI